MDIAGFTLGLSPLRLWREINSLRNQHKPKINQTTQKTELDSQEFELQ